MENKKILIVEDDPDASSAMRDILELSGFSLETAPNAFEAVRKVRENKPDLLLIDISLPDGDGVLLARTLGLAQGVPVIIMTGLSTFPLEEPLSANPFVKFILFKPCSPRTLIAAVREALGEAHVVLN